MANPKQTDSPQPDSPQPEQLEAPPAPKLALVIENADGTHCRPPVGAAIHSLGPVVIGNWFGHIDGRKVTVDHGTPLRGLPPAVLKRLRETPEQKLGPYDPRKPAGTQALPG